jgi:hypothetical protein
MEEVFMQARAYKGYEIEAVPQQLVDSGEWTVEIAIVHDRKGNRTYRKFSAGNRCTSKEGAVQHCFDFGKQIIDGKVKDCSVTDL